MTALAIYATAVTVLLVVAVAFLVVLVQDGRKIAMTAAKRMVADRDGASS